MQDRIIRVNLDFLLTFGRFLYEGHLENTGKKSSIFISVNDKSRDKAIETLHRCLILLFFGFKSDEEDDVANYTSILDQIQKEWLETQQSRKQKKKDRENLKKRSEGLY